MYVCMHGVTSDRFDFKTAMEEVRQGRNSSGRAHARQGSRIRSERISSHRKAFAGRSGFEGSLVQQSDRAGRAERYPEHRASRILKWKVELARSIGADRLVAPSAGTGMYTASTTTNAESTICAKPQRSRNRSASRAHAGIHAILTLRWLAADRAEAGARSRAILTCAP